MKFQFLLSLLLLLTSQFVHAQDDVSFDWGQKIESINGTDVIIRMLEIDNNDNIYITGLFTDSINLGTISNPHLLTSSTGTPSGFIAKKDDLGNTLWARMIDVTNMVSLNFLTVHNNDIYVGGDYVGFPTDETPFPQTMLVDYVRVYQEAGQ